MRQSVRFIFIGMQTSLSYVGSGRNKAIILLGARKENPDGIKSVRQNFSAARVRYTIFLTMGSFFMTMSVT